ncbi:anaerobic ribonucleoside-triphosphate reductase [Shigella flexneri]
MIEQSILRNRIAGLGKNRKTAVFPKLVLAIRDGLNHKFGDPNYDIKQLALECASKRMYSDILNYDRVVKVTSSFKSRWAVAASSACGKTRTATDSRRA